MNGKTGEVLPKDRKTERYKKEEEELTKKSRLEEKGVNSVAEGEVMEGEISHGGVKPKAAGRKGGMEEGVKREGRGIRDRGRHGQMLPQDFR